MVSPDLKIDMTDLSNVQTSIDSIVDILNNNALFRDGAADSVGHAGLAAKIQEFSNNWNDRREDVLERLEFVRDSLGKIEDSFTQVDTDLATALASPPPAPATTNGP